MSIETENFVFKPRLASAVRITADNMLAVASECNGVIKDAGLLSLDNPDDGVPYIELKVLNRGGRTIGRAFVGDWLVSFREEFRVYSDGSFKATFNRVGAKYTSANLTAGKYRRILELVNELLTIETDLVNNVPALGRTYARKIGEIFR